jgi:hypothetical protein
VTERADAALHNRMPAIYDARMGRQWLKDAPDHPMILSAVLQPILRRGWKHIKFEIGSTHRRMTRRNAASRCVEAKRITRNSASYKSDGPRLVASDARVSFSVTRFARLTTFNGCGETSVPMKP